MSTERLPFFFFGKGLGNTLAFAADGPVSRVGTYCIREGVGVYFPMGKNAEGRDVCFCAHIIASGYDLHPDDDGELRPTGCVIEANGRRLQNQIVQRLIKHAKHRGWDPRNIKLNTVKVVCPSLQNSMHGICSGPSDEFDESTNEVSETLRLTTWYIEQAIDEFLSKLSDSKVVTLPDKDSDGFVADARSGEVRTFDYDNTVADPAPPNMPGLKTLFEAEIFTDPAYHRWAFNPEDPIDEAEPINQPDPYSQPDPYPDIDPSPQQGPYQPYPPLSPYLQLAPYPQLGPRLLPGPYPQPGPYRQPRPYQPYRPPGLRQQLGPNVQPGPPTQPVPASQSRPTGQSTGQIGGQQGNNAQPYDELYE